MAELRLTARPHHAPALDGLRGVAILCVILAHAGAPLFGGSLVMFTLSGFLITARLLQEYDHAGGIDVMAFYVRRLRRLWPALIVMLAVVNGIVLITQPSLASRLMTEALYALVGLGNWSQLWITHTGLLIHLWSLAIEIQFYALWPLVVILLRGRGVLAVSLAIAILSWGIRGILLASQVPIGVVYMATYTRLDGLFIGCALAAALSSSGHARLTQWAEQYPALMTALQAAAVSVLAVCLLVYPLRQPLTYVVSLPLVALCAVVLIAACVLPQRTGIARVLGHAGLGALGHISYGVYLWHWPVKLLAHDNGLLGAVGGVLLGALSWRWIEAPLMKAKRTGDRATDGALRRVRWWVN